MEVSDDSDEDSGNEAEELLKAFHANLEKLNTGGLFTGFSKMDSDKARPEESSSPLNTTQDSSHSSDCNQAEKTSESGDSAGFVSTDNSVFATAQLDLEVV